MDNDAVTTWVAMQLRASPHTLAAVSAALWGLVGQPVTLNDLQWARRLLGDDAPQRLRDALRVTGVLHGTPPVIQPAALAALVAAWTSEPEWPTLAVTRPPWLATTLADLPTTRDVITYLIATASETIRITAPYLDPEGMGLLLAPLRAAASRGVQVMVATHHLDDPHHPNTRALALLRAELPHHFTAIPLPTQGHGGDGGSEPLRVHAKLILIDAHTALIGSANLTKAGLMGNIEVGIAIQGPEVAYVRLVWQMILATASRPARG